MSIFRKYTLESSFFKIAKVIPDANLVHEVI